MENQNNGMTVKDVLTEVHRQLNDLNIPVALVETIGIPIANAINGIKMCLDAMNRPPVPVPEIELAEADEEAQLEGEADA